jgi:chromosome segregation ATPase
MNNDEMTTQPTIETILARFDEWGARVTNELSQLRAGQDELRKGQDELRKGQDELRKGQDELRKGQDELRKGQGELSKGQEGLRAELNTGLRRVERKIEILNDNLLTIKADIRDLEVRLEKVESDSLARS